MRLLLPAICAAIIVPPVAGCVTEVHMTGNNNRVQVGPQAETTAGRDVTSSTTTADVQTNPTTSFLPW